MCREQSCAIQDERLSLSCAQVGYVPAYILLLAGDVKPTHFSLESFVEWINE